MRNRVRGTYLELFLDRFWYDIEDAQVRLLNLILFGVSFFAILAVTANYYDTFRSTYADGTARPQNWNAFWIMFVLLMPIWITTFQLNWSLRVRSTILFTVLFILALLDLVFAGVVGDARVTFVVLTALIYIFVSRRAGIIFTAIASLLIFLSTALFQLDLLPLNRNFLELYLYGANWARTMSYYAAMVYIIVVSFGLTQQQVREALYKEYELDQSLEERKLILEQRIQERTRSLRTSTAVSRRLSNLLTREGLIEEVVTLLKTTYNYYHVHIYFFDEERQYLYLEGGTGEPARVMRANNHRMPIWQGLVGQAGGAGRPVLEPDVSTSTQWSRNPLLPDTKGELAVPIVIQDEVLGVLDVQHDQPDRLDTNDVFLVQVVADQLAVALQNATLYEQVAVQAREQQVINEIARKIRGATSIEAVLQTAAEELTVHLKARRAHIQLGHRGD